MSTQDKSLPFSKEELALRQESDIKNELITPDIIYMDLFLLKDFTIGALITHLNTLPEEDAVPLYAEIRKNLVDYDHRITDDVAQYFPSFNLTTDEIEAMIRDPANTDSILLYAPGTQFIVAMQENLKVNVNHSTVDRKFKKVRVDGSTSRYYKQWDDVTYLVNTWPLPKPQGESLRKLQIFFTETFQSNIIVTSKDPKTLPKEVYATVDEFNFYQLGRHNENPDFSKNSVNMKYTQKMGLSSMVFERAKLKPHMFVEKGFRAETEIIHAQCNLMYRYFDWINPGYLTTDVSQYAEIAKMFDEDTLAMITKEVLENATPRT